MAVASILSGFLSATLARVKETPVREVTRLVGTLSKRETDVAILATAGRSNVEIGLQLGIARETVKQALHRVYRKMNVRGRVELTRKLVARGIVMD